MDYNEMMKAAVKQANDSYCKANGIPLMLDKAGLSVVKQEECKAIDNTDERAILLKIKEEINDLNYYTAYYRVKAEKKIDVIMALLAQASAPRNSTGGDNVIA